MRTIIFIILFLNLYFGICIFAGMKAALAVLSILMLTLATVFLVKKNSYVKYIEFVNPKYSFLYNAKGDDFKKKHRITDISAFYILSAIMLFLTASIPNVTLPFQGSMIIFLIISTVVISICLWCFSLLILKQSKKNSSFWFYFIAMILVAILILAIVGNLIF